MTTMDMGTIELATFLMSDFAHRTGLDPVKKEPRRYLWTDAFAVCNFLELHKRTGDQQYRELALRLVDQVHHTLGRHRKDDRRSGWISGLDEEEGARHPTLGGLRIGKAMGERGKDERPDPELEWEQDGQYYHYLTKWMHALERVSSATDDPTYLQWSVELARTAHARFTHAAPGGRRMYWKMSIDLTYPLVPSMGQHDALDGLVTFMELREAANRLGGASFPDLSKEIRELLEMSRMGSWATDDMLGAGALLVDAWKVVQLDKPELKGLLESMMEASTVSVDHIAIFNDLQQPAGQRLAFRELGLSIGLRAMERMNDRTTGKDRTDAVYKALITHVDELGKHKPIADRIEAFWSDPAHRRSSTWMEHEDINAVMLATSLAPGEFLLV